MHNNHKASGAHQELGPLQDVPYCAAVAPTPAFVPFSRVPCLERALSHFCLQKSSQGPRSNSNPLHLRPSWCSHVQKTSLCSFKFHARLKRLRETQLTLSWHLLVILHHGDLLQCTSRGHPAWEPGRSQTHFSTPSTVYLWKHQQVLSVVKDSGLGLP